MHALMCVDAHNHHGQRHRIMSDKDTGDKCPRHSESGSWEHMVQHYDMCNTRAEFIVKLKQNKIKIKNREVTQIEMNNRIEEIRMSMMEGDEDKTNQHSIGMKERFRGHAGKG